LNGRPGDGAVGSGASIALTPVGRERRQWVGPVRRAGACSRPRRRGQRPPV